MWVYSLQLLQFRSTVKIRVEFCKHLDLTLHLLQPHRTVKIHYDSLKKKVYRNAIKTHPTYTSLLSATHLKFKQLHSTTYPSKPKQSLAPANITNRSSSQAPVNPSKGTLPQVSVKPSNRTPPQTLRIQATAPYHKRLQTQATAHNHKPPRTQATEPHHKPL